MEASGAVMRNYSEGYEQYRDGRKEENDGHYGDAQPMFSEAMSEFEQARSAAENGTVRSHCDHAVRMARLYRNYCREGGQDSLSGMAVHRDIVDEDPVASPSTVRDAPYGPL